MVKAHFGGSRDDDSRMTKGFFMSPTMTDMVVQLGLKVIPIARLVSVLESVKARESRFLEMVLSIHGRILACVHRSRGWVGP